MLQLSSVYIANARFAFTDRFTIHTQHKTHEDGETYLKTCGPGNSTATVQITGAGKLSWFCTVGTWKIHVP